MKRILLTMSVLMFSAATLANIKDKCLRYADRSYIGQDDYKKSYAYCDQILEQSGRDSDAEAASVCISSGGIRSEILTIEANIGRNYNEFTFFRPEARGDIISFDDEGGFLAKVPEDEDFGEEARFDGRKKTLSLKLSKFNPSFIKLQCTILY